MIFNTISKKSIKNKKGNGKKDKDNNKNSRIRNKGFKTKKNIKFKRLNCSPNVDKKNYTCYSDDDLHKIRDIWNARHQDKKINTNDSKEIWLQLKHYYSRICNKESCWVNKLVNDNKLKEDLLDSFAPETPIEWKKNPNEWLSSLDIIEVMQQYEKAYKCFEFLGPSPIDYNSQKLYGQCVWEELCHFDLSSHLKKGKYKFGIIFNTDTHDKPGEHWVSLFINVKKKTIFFFDSVGNKIPNKIKEFVDMVTKQGLQLNPPIVFKFDENYPVEHQYKNTECGIYSLFFIVHMLEDKINSTYLKTHILKDEFIEKFRKIYYNEKL